MWRSGARAYRSQSSNCLAATLILAETMSRISQYASSTPLLPRLFRAILITALLHLTLLGVNDARADDVRVIRIGVATGGVGSPPWTGRGIIGIVNAQELLEKEFAPDHIKVEWYFFKGAGPAVNEAIVNHQLDLAWQGDLPSTVHRAAGVKTRIILGSGVVVMDQRPGRICSIVPVLLGHRRDRLGAPFARIKARVLAQLFEDGVSGESFDESHSIQLDPIV